MLEKTKEGYRIKYILSILGLILLGLSLIILGQTIKDDFWASVFLNIASALFITGVYGLINEYVLKDKLVELILGKLNLKESIDKTGIERVFSNIGEIDFNYYLSRGEKQIDILHIYGRTWTNNHIDEIRDRLLRSNCKIRVVLLSPDSPFIPALAKDYDITPDELKSRINEVVRTWRSLYEEKNKIKRKRTQSSIEVYLSEGKPFYSLYRIDDRIIQVTSKISKGKTKLLPSLICRNTSRNDDLYDFYKNEIDESIAQTEKVNLERNSG